MQKDYIVLTSDENGIKRNVYLTTYLISDMVEFEKYTKVSMMSGNTYKVYENVSEILKLIEKSKLFTFTLK